MINIKILFLLILFCCIRSICIAQPNELLHIRPFGTNPGNLKMYAYAPKSRDTTKALPLVVVLHGCTQTAHICAKQTGWNALSERHGFYVVYPEQIILNNIENCFNWFKEKDQERGKGEPESIKQMIDYMQVHYKINTSKIYVIGMSAGGAMSTVMISVYPELFDKGGVMAGGPYKASTSVVGSAKVMFGTKIKSPENWSQLIKNQNPNYTGSYPELVIFHGNHDLVVNVNNAKQLIKQWTHLNNTDEIPDETTAWFDGNPEVELNIYHKRNKQSLIYYYKIKDLGHSVPLDTGACPRQGGHIDLFSTQKKFFSTYWAADFFGLIKQPYFITGDTSSTLDKVQTYFVPENTTSTYKWHISQGSEIIGDETKARIQVKFGNVSGIISVTETFANGCKNDASKVYVNVVANK